MRKIVSIGKKINNDKKEINDFINNVNKEKKKADAKAKEKGIKNVATAGCIIATVATGGAVAAILGRAAICNGIRLIIDCKNLADWKKQAKIYQEKNEKAIKKYEEIDLELANLRNMCTLI